MTCHTVLCTRLVFARMLTADREGAKLFILTLTACCVDNKENQWWVRPWLAEEITVFGADYAFMEETICGVAAWRR